MLQSSLTNIRDKELENEKKIFLKRWRVQIRLSNKEGWIIHSSFWRNNSQWAMVSSFTRFLDHTQWRSTVGKIPLGKWSARRRDLYLTTHNTHNRNTTMILVGFKPTISAVERPLEPAGGLVLDENIVRFQSWNRYATENFTIDSNGTEIQQLDTESRHSSVLTS